MVVSLFAACYCTSIFAKLLRHSINHVDKYTRIPLPFLPEHVSAGDNYAHARTVDTRLFSLRPPRAWVRGYCSTLEKVLKPFWSNLLQMLVTARSRALKYIWRYSSSSWGLQTQLEHCLDHIALVRKVTEGVSGGGVSGHAPDFLLFSKRTATGPSCVKSIHVPHLRALLGCSLVSSKLIAEKKKVGGVSGKPPLSGNPLCYLTFRFLASCGSAMSNWYLIFSTFWQNRSKFSSVRKC